MPYSGIPAGSAAEAKIDRCVERVMAGGETDKSAAIAICRSSIGKAMDTENEKQTEDSANFVQVGKQTAKVESVTTTNAGMAYVDASKMEHGIGESMDYYDPVMGAMSFSELDTIEQAQEQHGKLRRIVDNFMRLARNITQNPAIDPTDRSAALRNLTEEMRMRLDADFERGERTISIPTINGKLDPVYLQKLQDSKETADVSRNESVFDSPHNTGFKVLKAVDGSFRWLGWVSNKFMDREGEILTDEAHKDYIAWLDAHPKAAPQLWTYHTPGTQRESKADFWAYLNGFLILGGKLTEQEAKVFDNVSDDLGMSHGFYVLGKQQNLINKYRTFEATVLPRRAAANPWTEFNVKELGNMALTNDQRQMLAQLHGEDFANALEDGTKQRAEVLESAGIQSKQKEDGAIGGGKADGSIAGSKEIPADAVLVEEIQATESEVEAVLNTADLAKSVADLVTKQLNPAGLHEAIKTLNESNSANATAIENVVKRLEALELSDDQKMANELAPKVPGIDWMGGFRASAEKATVVTEKEKETFKNSKPDESWASNLFNLGGG